MNDPEKKQAPLEALNGNAEVARLGAHVEKLEQECSSLREALQRAEYERALYLKAVYEHTRETLDFQDVDLAELERISAGPVEFI